MANLETHDTDRRSGKSVLTVEEFIDRGGVLDNTAVFAKLEEIMRSLRERMLAAFALTPSASNERYSTYASPNGNCRGSLNTFRGPGVDWLVDSWMGNPETGFTNLHFNTWLSAETNVPHLAIVLGTVPEIFFYFDFVPRADLTTNLAYFDKYYGEAQSPSVNRRYIAFQENAQMKPFVSRDVYMRQAISPVGLCFTCPRDAANIELLRKTAHEMMDQWLGWVAAGEAVPASEQKALAARDHGMRRAIAERDPANSLAERLLGKAEMETLVKLLWGVQPDHE